MSETAALFSAEDHVNSLADEYKTRLAAVLERVNDYHPDCQRRYACDAYHDAARNVQNSAKWLAGDFDRTWAGQLGSIEAFRAHYADDALRAALHFLVWAEHYAGLRDRDSAMRADPWR